MTKPKTMIPPRTQGPMVAYGFAGKANHHGHQFGIPRLAVPNLARAVGRCAFAVAAKPVFERREQA
jgi:hypothetical protein